MLAQLVEHGLVVAPAGRRGATCAKFFAAPRSIDGPPTSIISTASSSVTPRRARPSLERVEVDADEVERLDPVLGERGDVVLRPSRRARMPAWMRGCSVLTRPPSISGNSVRLSTRVTVEAELLEVRRRAAARDELAAELGEPARELVEPGLVVDRDQRAHSSLTTSRQEPVLDGVDARDERLARLDRDAAPGAMTGPVSMPSSTKWTVTPVVSTPAASASSIALRAREVGQRATGGR